MLLGILLVLGAYGLIAHNQQEDQNAEVFVDELVPLIREEISQAQQSTATEPINIPKELLNPEDMIMTEKIIDGYAYIGYLTIPDLDLELPVMSGWDSRRLQKSPCRFTGTLKGEDLVIMAHITIMHTSACQSSPRALWCSLWTWMGICGITVSQLWISFLPRQWRK